MLKDLGKGTFEDEFGDVFEKTDEFVGQKIHIPAIVACVEDCTGVVVECYKNTRVGSSEYLLELAEAPSIFYEAFDDGHVYSPYNDVKVVG